MFNRISMEETLQEVNPSQRLIPKMTLTMAELTEELNISLPTARKLVREEGFPAFSIGNRILINREGLQRWLDNQPPLSAA